VPASKAGAVSTGKLHEDEVEIDERLVRGLLAAQLPDLATLPLHRFASTGTVNAVYRLGPDRCIRLPRVARWAANLEKEAQWLPVLAPHLPLAVPEPLALGEPGLGYPFPWAVYRWLEGDLYEAARVDDEHQAALDLGAFVAALRGIDPTGAPRSGRAPLDQLDVATRYSIGMLDGAIDADAAAAAWDVALGAPPWDGTPVWRHGDLLTANLLVRGGRLRAVIDFGDVGVGDPASDVVPAWSVFGAAGRAAFRTALDVDEATWSRARGYALHQALCIVPYYRETNPAFSADAVRTVEEVLADAR